MESFAGDRASYLLRGRTVLVRAHGGLKREIGMKWSKNHLGGC